MSVKRDLSALTGFPLTSTPDVRRAFLTVLTSILFLCTAVRGGEHNATSARVIASSIQPASPNSGVMSKTWGIVRVFKDPFSGPLSDANNLTVFLLPSRKRAPLWRNGKKREMSPLPLELYRPVVESVNGRRDLLTLIRTTRMLRDEAERVLYANPNLYFRHSDAQAKFLAHITWHERHALLVRKISIHIAISPPLPGELNSRARGKVSCSSHLSSC